MWDSAIYGRYLIFTDDKDDNICHKNLLKDMEYINKWLNENKIKLLEITMDNKKIFKINNVIIKKLIW